MPVVRGVRILDDFIELVVDGWIVLCGYRTT